jgi:hypothetical protein
MSGMDREGIGMRGKVGSAQFDSLDDRLQLYTHIPEHNASIQDIVD